MTALKCEAYIYSAMLTHHILFETVCNALGRGSNILYIHSFNGLLKKSACVRYCLCFALFLFLLLVLLLLLLSSSLSLSLRQPLSSLHYRSFYVCLFISIHLCARPKQTRNLWINTQSNLISSVFASMLFFLPGFFFLIPFCTAFYIFVIWCNCAAWNAFNLFDLYTLACCIDVLFCKVVKYGFFAITLSRSLNLQIYNNKFTTSL